MKINGDKLIKDLSEQIRSARDEKRDAFSWVLNRVRSGRWEDRGIVGDSETYWQQQHKQAMDEIEREVAMRTENSETWKMMVQEEKQKRDEWKEAYSKEQKHAAMHFEKWQEEKSISSKWKDAYDIEFKKVQQQAREADQWKGRHEAAGRDRDAFRDKYDNLCLHLRVAEQERDKYKKDAEERQRDFSVTYGKLMDVEAERDKYHQAQESIRESYNRVCSQLAEVKEQRESQTERAVKAEQKLNHAKVKEGNLLNERESLRSDMEMRKNECISLHGSLDRLKEQLENVQQEPGSYAQRKKISELTDNLEQHRAALSIAKDKMNQALEAHKQSEGRGDILARQIEEAEEYKKMQQREIESLQEKNENLNDANIRMGENVQHWHSKCGELERQLQEPACEPYNDQLNRLQSENWNQRKELSALKEERRMLRAKLDDLEENPYPCGCVDDNTVLREQIKEKAEHLRNCGSLVDALRADIDSLQGEIATVRSEKHSLLEANHQQELAYAEVVETRENVRKANRELRETNDKLRDKLKETEEMSEKRYSKAVEWQNERDELREENRKLLEENKEWQESLEMVNHTNANISQTNLNLLGRLAEARKVLE